MRQQTSVSAWAWKKWWGEDARGVARRRARFGFGTVEELEPKVLLSATDSLGVFRAGQFYLEAGPAGTSNVGTIAYGQTGDQALEGDWNGDGTDQPGVYRNGVFYLQGVTPFAFGKAGDKAIVGDWNGDGVDQVGVFRAMPNGTGEFILDLAVPGTNGGKTIPTLTFNFGLSTDLPVVGDWNGDGKDTVGVFRNGTFILETGALGTSTNTHVTFGKAGDIPIAGDWDGNGTDQVGVFRSGQFLLNVGTNTAPSTQYVLLGQAGDTPVVGDWDDNTLTPETFADVPDTQALTRTGYDYAPTVIFDGTKYQMWWMGNVKGSPGDNILYSTAPTPNGPWTTPVSVFTGNGSASSFDGLHTGDPSVIYLNGTYYMYYGGFPTAKSSLPQTTMIGVATSTDGVHWTRSSTPIVEPHGNYKTAANPYGAGQPSVFEMGGYVYMLYTDTTGAASAPASGGIYVIRSTNPLFKGAVQELTANGWVTRSSTAALTTQYAITTAAASVDAVYDPVNNAIIVALPEVQNQINLLIFDTNFNLQSQMVVPNVSWTEGPGFVRTDTGSVVGESSTPGAPLPLRIFHSNGTFWAQNASTWNLAYTTIHITDGKSPVLS